VGCNILSAIKQWSRRSSSTLAEEWFASSADTATHTADRAVRWWLVSVACWPKSGYILPLKNCVFWDVTPCGSCKNRRFGGTQRLLHQGGAKFPRNVGSYKSHTA
jgi:hypothetical protein